MTALSRAVAFVEVRVRDTVVRLVEVGAAVDVRVRLLLVTEVLERVAASRVFVETTAGPPAVMTVRIRLGLSCVSVRRPKDRLAFGMPLPPPAPIYTG